jgi:hypothetical protein
LFSIQGIKKPSGWQFCGYNEIQEPKRRYSLINRQRLHSVAGSGDEEKFRISHQGWILESLRKNSHEGKTIGQKALQLEENILWKD